MKTIFNQTYNNIRVFIFSAIKKNFQSLTLKTNTEKRLNCVGLGLGHSYETLNSVGLVYNELRLTRGYASNNKHNKNNKKNFMSSYSNPVKHEKRSLCSIYHCIWIDSENRDIIHRLPLVKLERGIDIPFEIFDKDLFFNLLEDYHMVEEGECYSFLVRLKTKTDSFYIGKLISFDYENQILLNNLYRDIFDFVEGNRIELDISCDELTFHLNILEEHTPDLCDYKDVTLEDSIYFYDMFPLPKCHYGKPLKSIKIPRLNPTNDTIEHRVYLNDKDFVVLNSTSPYTHKFYLSEAGAPLNCSYILAVYESENKRNISFHAFDTHGN